MSDNYPGKGIAWADFLHHRRRVIKEFVADGKSFAAIVTLLSMDEGQVKLIHERGATATEGIFSRERLARAAMKQDI